jgi:hypothetical protein
VRAIRSDRGTKGRTHKPRWPQFGSLAVAGLAAVAAVAVLAVGCARLTPLAEADHDHAAEGGVHSAHDHAHEHAHADDHNHDHAAAGQAATSPASFADALATVIELDAKIRTACEGDDPDAAHDELHSIGHLLEELPGLATTAGAPLDGEAVRRSAGVLFDAFSRIDDKLHGGEGSTYAEEAETIGRELGSFRAFLVEHKP